MTKLEAMTVYVLLLQIWEGVPPYSHPGFGFVTYHQSGGYPVSYVDNTTGQFLLLSSLHQGLGSASMKADLHPGNLFSNIFYLPSLSYYHWSIDVQTLERHSLRSYKK
jgi:hypothetical protein